MKHLVSIVVLIFALQASSQILHNGDFESHSAGIPDHWMMDINGSDLDLGGGTNGSAALRVWTWYSYVTGIAVNGYKTYNYNSLLGLGTPYNLKPSALTGMYRYDTSSTNTSGDSAIVEVYLKKYNASLGEVDTVMTGSARLAPTSGNDFSSFSVGLSDLMVGTTPDSLVIVFKSAQSGFCAGNNCLYLTVDDLALEFGNDISESDAMPLLRFYPNPANESVQFESEAENSQVEIYDLFGKLCSSYLLTSGNHTINTEGLSSGTYSVRLIQDGSIRHGRLVVQH